MSISVTFSRTGDVFECEIQRNHADNSKAACESFSGAHDCGGWLAPGLQLVLLGGERVCVAKFSKFLYKVDKNFVVASIPYFQLLKSNINFLLTLISKFGVRVFKMA